MQPVGTTACTLELLFLKRIALLQSILVFFIPLVPLVLTSPLALTNKQIVRAQQPIWMAVIGSSHWTEAASCRWRDEQTQITPHSLRAPLPSPLFWCFFPLSSSGCIPRALERNARTWLGNLGAVLGAFSYYTARGTVSRRLQHSDGGFDFKIKMHLIVRRAKAGSFFLFETRIFLSFAPCSHTERLFVYTVRADDGRSGAHSRAHANGQIPLVDASVGLGYWLVAGGVL